MIALHEDEHLLVLDKPSGLLSVPGRGPDKQDCLSKRVQDIYPDALVVHRLDQDTSGLLVMARGIEAQRRMSRLFEARQVHKRYWAVVAANVQTKTSGGSVDAQGWHTIDGPILLDWERRPLHTIHPDGKPARSRWRALECTDTASLIELEPVTGRTHQLRVHMQSVGHPMLGDALYAPSSVLALAPRLMLHAHSLVFEHPFTAQPMAFSAPMAWSAQSPYGPFESRKAVTFDNFKARVLADGFDEVLQKEWGPSTAMDTRTRPFKIKVHLLAGQAWLHLGQQMRYFSAGDEFTLDRDTPHAVRLGNEGAKFWVARKH